MDPKLSPPHLLPDPTLLAFRDPQRGPPNTGGFRTNNPRPPPFKGPQPGTLKRRRRRPNPRAFSLRLESAMTRSWQGRTRSALAHMHAPLRKPVALLAKGPTPQYHMWSGTVRGQGQPRPAVPNLLPNRNPFLSSAIRLSICTVRPEPMPQALRSRRCCWMTPLRQRLPEPLPGGGLPSTLCSGTCGRVSSPARATPSPAARGQGVQMLWPT